MVSTVTLVRVVPSDGDNDDAGPSEGSGIPTCRLDLLPGPLHTEIPSDFLTVEENLDVKQTRQNINYLLILYFYFPGILNKTVRSYVHKRT